MRDGDFTKYAHIRDCSPITFDQLATIVSQGSRHVGSVQASGVFAAPTVFYADALPLSTSATSHTRRLAEAARREEWFERAVDTVKNADLVFFDPDNGIAGKCQKHSKRAVKYVFEDEIRRILGLGKSVVVYQHQHRSRAFSVLL